MVDGTERDDRYSDTDWECYKKQARRAGMKVRLYITGENRGATGPEEIIYAWVDMEMISAEKFAEMPIEELIQRYLVPATENLRQRFAKVRNG